MKIGFIGMGIMGSRMAANLLKNDYEVIIYNKTKSKAEPVLKLGAEWGGSIAETASQSYILFTMLSTPEVVSETAFGDDGFLDNLAENSIWVDCTTVNPTYSKFMAAEAKKKNIRFVDAPVAGSLKPAENGELVFLTGGNSEDIDEVRNLLHIMGKRIVFAGENGQGSAMKMIVNMLMGVSIAAYTEALSLGQSLGINKEVLLDTLPELPVIAPIVKMKTNNFLNEEFPPEFPLKWAQKDLHLASVSAYEKDIAAPMLNSAKELYALAKQYGFSDEDFSAVYKVLNKKI